MGNFKHSTLDNLRDPDLPWLLRDVRDNIIDPRVLINAIIENPNLSQLEHSILLCHLPWEEVERINLVLSVLRRPEVDDYRKFILLKGLQEVLWDEVLPLAGILALYYWVQVNDTSIESSLEIYRNHLLWTNIWAFEQSSIRIIEWLSREPWNIPIDIGKTIVQSLLNFMTRRSSSLHSNRPSVHNWVTHTNSDDMPIAA